MEMWRRFCIMGLLTLLSGCGHEHMSKVGLMSFGDLEGKTIPQEIKGAPVTGSSCGGSSYLSDAVRDALKETEFDTLLDAEVTSVTGLLVFNNCINVKGIPLNSKKLIVAGGK